MSFTLERLRWWARHILFVALCYFFAACTDGLIEWRLEPPPLSIGNAINVSVATVRPPPFGLANLNNLQYLLSTTQPAVTATNTVAAASATVKPGAHPSQVAAAPPRAAAPKLTGTLAGSGHSLAVLQTGNETHIVGIGEQVDGYTVLQVTQFEAKVRDPDGQSFNLTMGLANTNGVATLPPPPLALATPTPTGSPTPAANGTFSTRELRQMLDHTGDYAATMNVHAVRRGDEVAGYQVNYSAPNNPFAKLGIQNNDILLSFQNRPLKGPEDLTWAYSELRNATSLSFSVERNGKVMPLNVQLTD